VTLGGDTWRREEGRSFGDLDTVTASEMLRTITLLVESDAQ
jgi:hypothetical protein